MTTSIEARIKRGDHPDDILKDMQLQYKYAYQLLEKTHKEYFNTPKCDEARRRISRYKELLKNYKTKRKAIPAAKNMTEADIRAAQGTKDYERLALYRIDSNFFDKLPGLEVHQLWKQTVIVNINKP